MGVQLISNRTDGQRSPPSTRTKNYYFHSKLHSPGVGWSPILFKRLLRNNTRRFLFSIGLLLLVHGLEVDF